MLMLAKLMESPKILKLLPYGRLRATRPRDQHLDGISITPGYGGAAAALRSMERLPQCRGRSHRQRRARELRGRRGGVLERPRGHVRILACALPLHPQDLNGCSTVQRTRGRECGWLC